MVIVLVDGGAMRSRDTGEGEFWCRVCRFGQVMWEFFVGRHRSTYEWEKNINS
jgi:hypothetical protein